jgi:hypothetical protein
MKYPNLNPIYCATRFGAQALANEMNRSEPRTHFPWIVEPWGAYWTVVRQKARAREAVITTRPTQMEEKHDS